MRVDFVKMQGLGNDFIVINDWSCQIELGPAQVQRLCDRRYGIGADGLMLVRPPADPARADARWWFANDDGSQPEMCGNGLRCAARYAAEQGLLPRGASVLRLETLAGVKTATILRDGSDGGGGDASPGAGSGHGGDTHGGDTPNGSDGATSTVRVDMGTAVPDSSVTLAGRDWARVSMGNPHAVTFVDDLPQGFGSAPVTSLGPTIETDATFPHKTNVEFVQRINDHTLRMRVWERGVGETLACGTGACAAAVAAHRAGLTTSAVTVELLGGSLLVEVGDDLRVQMTGPAQTVYTGQVELVV